MADLEQQLAAVMNDPSMMQKIMSFAQTLGNNDPPEPPRPQNEAPPMMPELDIATLQKLSGFMSKSGIDPNQKALLQALGPYLSQQRVGRLERAMRAAKMAGFATSLLGR